MFIRQKKNKSGVISIQIIGKSSGKYKVVKTIGSSKDIKKVVQLYIQAQQEKERILGQTRINFEIDKERNLVDTFFDGIEAIKLLGPELLLGKIFDQIGFNSLKDEMFRYLVITRLVYPVSKLKTVSNCTRLLIKYDEQAQLLKLFEINFGCPSAEDRR